MDDSILLTLVDLSDIDNVTLHYQSDTVLHQMTTDRIGIASMYILLFLVGVAGNSAVIYVIISLLCRTKNNANCTGMIRIFVVSLSVVDLLILLQMLLVVIDLCSFRWRFGLQLCRGFWAVDSFYKLAGSFMQVGISATNYLAACHSVFFLKMAKAKVAVTFVIGASIVAVLLTLPIMPYVTVNYLGHLSEDGKQFEVLRENCIFEPPDALLKSFLSYVFVLHYCIPLLGQIKFNASMIAAVKHSRLGAQRHRAAINRTKRAVVPLISFYFICWTPYWLINWCLVVASNSMITADENLGILLSLLMYILHSLPYVHASINPILYAWLYKSIGLAYRRISKSSAKTTSRQMTTRL